MAVGVQKIIQSVLVYIVIVSVLRGLISNPKFGQYFQFFSGIILILLLFSPILSFFHCEDDWYTYLEEEVLQMDVDKVAGDLKIADKHFEEVAAKEYQESIEEQIILLAKQNDVELSDVTVTIEKEEDAWEIKEVQGKAQNETQAKFMQTKIANELVLGEEQVHLWR